VLDGRLEITVRKGRRDVVRHAGPGYASFLSGSERRTVVRMAGRARAVAVHMPREWFERLSFDGPPSTFGRTRPLVNDHTVQRLVQAMCDEITRSAPTGRLYAESLSTALLSYVLSYVAPSAEAVRGALSERECRQIRNLVRERLQDELSIEELSRTVGVGPRHFTRLFRAAFDTTPHQYVLRERLNEGARLLERGGHDVAYVALNVGFATQSHFTSAFRKAYGVTPGRYARERRKLGPRA
jgi:AraC-like DNA-binding protein